MDRALILVCALLLNACLAGPRPFYALLGLPALHAASLRLLRGLERRLNRTRRKAGERQARGAILLAVALLLAMGSGIALSILLTPYRFVEMGLVACCLPVRPGWDLIVSLRALLMQGRLAEARALLGVTAWRHHARLDAHGVARAGIELLAVQLSDKVIAPALAYLLLGLPGLLAVKAMALLRESVGIQGTRGDAFNRPIGRVHGWLLWLPSRAAGLLLVLACLLLPLRRPPRSLRGLLRGVIAEDARLLPVTGMATVCKVTLGGPLSVNGPEWTGIGTARAMPADVRIALAAYALVSLIFAASLGLLV